MSEWSEHEFIGVQHFVLKYPYSLEKKQNYVIRNIKLKISIERKIKNVKSLSKMDFEEFLKVSCEATLIRSFGFKLLWICDKWSECNVLGIRNDVLTYFYLLINKSDSYDKLKSKYQRRSKQTLKKLFKCFLISLHISLQMWGFKYLHREFRKQIFL